MKSFLICAVSNRVFYWKISIEEVMLMIAEAKFKQSDKLDFRN